MLCTCRFSSRHHSTNPRGQLSDGGHGDYFPACADNATIPAETPYDPLPNFPRDEDACTDFEGFYQDDQYDHSVMLTDDCVFQYKVSEGRVQGKLSYSGIFGYIALGFLNEGGAKNGMHGAQVIMATPGGDYSPITGLDFSLGPEVGEFVIPEDAGKSAFRHWFHTAAVDVDVAIERQIDAAVEHDVEFNDCYMSLIFDTADIKGRPFELEGMDSLIWAVNIEDTFAGYHDARGNFTVEWGTGEHSINTPLISEPSGDNSGAAYAAGSLLSALLFAVVGFFQW